MVLGPRPPGSHRPPTLTPTPTPTHSTVCTYPRLGTWFCTRFADFGSNQARWGVTGRGSDHRLTHAFTWLGLTRTTLPIAVATLGLASACSSLATDRLGAEVPPSELVVTAPEPSDPTSRPGSSETAANGSASIGDESSDPASSLVPGPSLEPASSAVPAPSDPLPGSSDELAAELTQAERAIRDPAVDTETAGAWGGRSQRLYSVLTDHPEWVDATLASIGDDVRDDVELDWVARQNLAALVTSASPATHVPAWRIKQPRRVEELLAAYHEAEATTGIPWSILAAINLIETRMGRIEGLSTAGALGPMQFLPSTWATCCVGDPTVDRDAIFGAAEYLRQSGAAADLDRAIFAYNHSLRYVNAVRAYATVMDHNALAYRGFHGYEVYFRSAAGLLHLAPGYEQPVAIDAFTWLAAHPEALVD